MDAQYDVTIAPILGDPLYSSDHHLSYLPGIGVQRGLYLHASYVSFHVSSSFLPNPRLHSITTKPSFPYPPSDFHQSRPRQASRRHRSSCSFAHYTFISQSYRQSGPRKRFRVGVTAPLPPYFVQACRKLRIPLTDEFIDGGVRIDDVRQDVSILREGEGTENGMQWLL